MRFEKVSFEAFRKDMMQYKPINFLGGITKETYDAIQLPRRKTQYSAGYDLVTPISFTIVPHRSLIIPTGVKAVFSEDEMRTWCLKLYARSGVGIKDKVVVTNSVGLIDADFQFSDNDGDMLLALTNIGESIKKYNAGDRICQAVFEIYGVTSDDDAIGKRTSGVGSTGR